MKNKQPINLMACWKKLVQDKERRTNKDCSCFYQMTDEENKCHIIKEDKIRGYNLHFGHSFNNVVVAQKDDGFYCASGNKNGMFIIEYMYTVHCTVVSHCYIFDRGNLFSS